MTKRDKLKPAGETEIYCPRCHRHRHAGRSNECPRHAKWSRVTEGADITVGDGPRVKVLSQSFTIEVEDEETDWGQTLDQTFRVSLETERGLAYSKFEFATEDAAADYADRVLTAGTVSPRFWFFM